MLRELQKVPTRWQHHAESKREASRQNHRPALSAQSEGHKHELDHELEQQKHRHH